MADNINVTAAADYNVSADEVTASSPARHVQRVKLAQSADGSEAHATVDADGVLVNLGANNDVTVTGDVAVTGPLTDGQLRASAVPVSAASLPLPSGAATAANQATIAGHVDGIEALLTAIDTDTGAIATDAAAIEALLTTIDADTGSLPGIATSVDGVEALLTTIDADTSALAAALKAATATAVSLASSTSSAQVVAANADRLGLHLTNTDANRCYLNFGAAASASAFVLYLDSGDYWEMPSPTYTGAVNALWAGDGSGSLIGVELD